MAKMLIILFAIFAPMAAAQLLPIWLAAGGLLLALSVGIGCAWEAIQ